MYTEYGSHVTWNNISHISRQLLQLCSAQLKQVTCEECNQAGATPKQTCQTMQDLTHLTCCSVVTINT